MKDMLDAMDHRRPIGAFKNVHDALETEDIVAAVLGERFEKERQRHSPDRLPAYDRIGLDVGIMARVRVSMRFFRQPRIDVSRLGPRVIETRVEDERRIDPAMIGDEHGCAGIELFETTEQHGFARSGQIQFGQDNPVRDGDLLLRDPLALERSRAVDGIHRRHDAAEHEAARTIRVRHQRLQDRRWIGKSARLDYDAIEARAAALVPPPQQVLKGLRQVRAALDPDYAANRVRVAVAPLVPS